MNFIHNRHVKSIVRGHDAITMGHNAHVFKTQFGTYDELMRPITRGFEKEYSPSYKHLRINHYVCQSYEYFHERKMQYGFADSNILGRRDDDTWRQKDINEESDDAIDRFRDKVAEIVAEIG